VLALADELADSTAKHSGIALKRLATVDPEGVIAAHPFRSKGYEFDVPLLAGDHVTSDTGTGFVHTAPGHGEEDFALMTDLFPGYAANHPHAFAIVKEDGSFGAQVPMFAGKRILTPEGKDGDANGAVIREL